MNEEFVNILYGIAQQNGYEDTVDDFVQLISTNPDLVSDMYDLASQNGYEDPIEDFEILVGFQKKKTKPKSIWFPDWKLVFLSQAHYQETSVLI